MAFRGDCGNCGRKDRPISKCKPPLCWTCQMAAKGKVGEERVKALAEIRERIISGDFISRNKYKKAKVEEKPQKEPGSGAIDAGSHQDKPDKVEGKAAYRGTFVDFTSPEDAALITRIEEIAKAERRTPSAQILYFLDRELKYMDQELAHG